MTVFHRQPLTQVLEEINRYRKGRIIAVNPKLAGGVFNNGDPDAVLAALTATLKPKPCGCRAIWCCCIDGIGGNLAQRADG
ncbi:hypothetical protein [Methylomonas sp. HYX-M1]|uniref:hypothetical protein n=1 Tax=Methylomonas sp. HYX-M1 TaxID=3139307 RepID=UPI00345C38E6